MKRNLLKFMILSVMSLFILGASAQDYLCFTAEEANSTVELKKEGSPTEVIIEYQVNGTDGSWTSVDFSSATTTGTITLTNAGDKVYFRNAAESVTNFSTSTDNHYEFSMEGKIAASGNVMSLIDKTCSATQIPCSYCFYKLFCQCESLTTAPKLPATTLKTRCYYSMFYQCESLTTAPKLPATTLAEGCYQSMFSGCSSLTTAPELPATTMANFCYNGMFSDCKKLNYIQVGFTYWTPSSATTNWLSNVSSTGTFVCPLGLTQTRGTSNIPSGWTVKKPDYLCFTAEKDNSTVALNKNWSPTAVTIEYKVNDGNWTSVDFSSATTTGTITLTNAGDKVYFRNAAESVTNFSTSTGNHYEFSMEGKIAASGNVMSLIDKTCEATEIPCDYCFHKLFYNCTSLTTAPKLPATTMAEFCYYYMFDGCTSLAAAPEISATTLERYCCGYMFNECTSLTTASELPATKLAEFCYFYMFNGCTSLTAAPKISATTLAYYCCGYMFNECTSLTTASNLSATTMAEFCYYNMFNGCTSLTAAPEISATTLARFCCAQMFSGCTSLTTAPELPATALTDFCYNKMFSGCEKLNYIKVGFTAWDPSSATLGWVDGVSSTGTFVCPLALAQTTGTGYIPSGWTVKKPDYLCFTAEEDGSTVTLNKKSYPTEVTLQTSTDGKNWSDYTFGNAITLTKAGDKVYFRNAAESVTNFSNGTLNYYYFSMSGKIAASGNVMSLIDKTCETTTIPNRYCFNCLFKNCTSLTTAPKLPATNLANYCYYYMFDGCTSLTAAPEISAKTMERYCCAYMFQNCTSLTTASNLPATTMAENCYFYMFSGCTSLTAAPEISAKTMERYCCAYMFQNCTSLTTAPELPAMTLAHCCYYYMFDGCTSLTAAPEISAKTLERYCCAFMFQNCKSLTTAPELPATKLADLCYQEMFSGCEKLNYIKVGFTAWDPSSATLGWVNGVSSTGTFVCPLGLAQTTGTSNIPDGWTVKMALNVSSIGWASLYSDKALEIPDGVKAYYASAVSRSSITLTEITGVIPAETAVIISAAEGEVQFPLYTGTAPDAIEGNLFEGVLKDTECAANSVYVLDGNATTPEKPVFNNYTGTTLGAHKAYLPKKNVPSNDRDLNFLFEGEETGIDRFDVNGQQSTVNSIFNLAGQKVGADYKGIVIVNGKKYIKQ